MHTCIHIYIHTNRQTDRLTNSYIYIHMRIYRSLTLFSKIGLNTHAAQPISFKSENVESNHKMFYAR